jgi:hypothetical protein
MNTQPKDSTVTLIGEVMAHISSLVRKEVDLARAEINQNVSRAVTAMGLLATAMVAALSAVNVLTAAIVAGLSDAGMAPGWAALLVGVVLAVIAAALASKGVKGLKLSSIAPSRTVENVKRDASTLKGAIND